MATGLIDQSPKTLTYRILNARTTTNSAPSGDTAGIDLSGIYGPFTEIERAALLVYNTAGTGTVTATIRLWGYNTLAAQWFPLGVGADLTKGTINGGVALGESGVADMINHSEPVYLVGLWDRAYAEVTAIGGTSTAVTVDLVINRRAV